MSNRLRTAIVVMVSLVWALNFTAPIYVKGYKPPTELNVAFMAVVGIVTASYKREAHVERVEVEKAKAVKKTVKKQPAKKTVKKVGGGKS